jgi:FAD:protein FMN transferase
MHSCSSAELVRSRPLLGTFVSVRAADADREQLSRGIDAAFAEIARIQTLMSFHDPASELSMVNREAHLRAIAVSPDLLSVLSLARELFEATNGAFDAAVAPHLVRWNYLPRHQRTTRGGTLGAMELQPQGCVRFARPLLLDLGGIAKGYAVDRAVEALRVAGVSRGVVNAGGDLRVFGDRAELVHVRHPKAPGRCIPIAELRDAAVATSASYFARRRFRRREVTPIVDPTSGAACTTTRSVSVIAPTCAAADALTKVVALRGDDAFPVLTRFDASTLILESNGSVLTGGVDCAA